MGVSGPHPTLSIDRERLELTQLDLSKLLHVSLLSLNRWERGLSKPSNISDAILQLLHNAIECRGPAVVLHHLRDIDSTVDMIRILVRIEKLDETNDGT